MTAAGFDALDGLSVVDLTTVGRVSGRPHTIEIWFARNGETLYLLSGGGERSDWVRNLQADAGVVVTAAGLELSATARVVRDPAEARLARDTVFAKYAPSYRGDLTAWRERSLPIAIDGGPGRPVRGWS